MTKEEIIRQLKSLLDNSKCQAECDPDEDIWRLDVEALDAAIGIVSLAEADAKMDGGEHDGRSFDAGQLIWIVERDEEGNPYRSTGYVFLAQVMCAAIVTPRINGVDDLGYTVNWHIKETCFNQDTNLLVFPIQDCYGTRDAAKAALCVEHKENELDP